MKYSMKKLPECEVCPKSGNTLACMLSDCQAREMHNYKILKNWHKKWIEDHCCFACTHCINISSDRDICNVCDLIAGDSECKHGLIPLKQTCEHFEAKPWEETNVYKGYTKKWEVNKNDVCQGTGAESV